MDPRLYFDISINTVENDGYFKVSVIANDTGEELHIIELTTPFKSKHHAASYVQSLQRNGFEYTVKSLPGKRFLFSM